MSVKPVSFLKRAATFTASSTLSLGVSACSPLPFGDSEATSLPNKIPYPGYAKTEVFQKSNRPPEASTQTALKERESLANRMLKIAREECNKLARQKNTSGSLEADLAEAYPKVNLSNYKVSLTQEQTPNSPVQESDLQYHEPHPDINPKTYRETIVYPVSLNFTCNGTITVSSKGSVIGEPNHGKPQGSRNPAYDPKDGNSTKDPTRNWRLKR